MTTATSVIGGRQIAWDRRRRALAAFWRRYRKDRSGMIGLVILVVMILVALAAPLLASSRGLNPGLATYPANAGPALRYPLGTDSDGRSVLTELIWGSRISLLIGFAATFLSMVIGAIIGIVAGHFGTLRNWFGRQTDNVLMRITDWFLVIPFLPLAIVLARTLGPSLHVIIFVIGITSWPGTAWIIRAQGARGRDQAVPRTVPGPRRRPLAPDVQARAAERDAASAGQHDPDRGRHDLVRDHALVPRPRRPDQ